MTGQAAVRPGALATGLFVASLPVLAREAARQRDPGLLVELAAARAVKLSAGFGSRKWFESRHPEGTDPEDYHAAGVRIGERLADGRFEGTTTMARTVPFDTKLPLVGTNAVRYLTGCLYAAAGPSKQNGFLVFSWLGFWGQFLHYRAFVVGVPDGDHRRYRRLVFFTPSLTFWSSILGKEPLMVLSLGTAALGCARTFERSARSGAMLVALGGAGAVVIRPHVVSVLGKGLLADLEEQAALTANGSAAFTPARPRGAVGLGQIVATVLFRPFPHEARNASAMLAAAEGLAMLLLWVDRARGALPSSASPSRRPYVPVAAFAAGGLTALLGGVANFGVLNRQRAPLLPFLFVLLCSRPRGR